MIKNNEINQIVVLNKTLQYNPRKNLPLKVSRKKTESLFVNAFLKAFLNLYTNQNGLVAKEFSLNGYGIADLIYLKITQSKWNDRDEIRTRKFVTAFEMKINDWQKALSQAMRYRYFANRVIVVLPDNNISRAKYFSGTFKSLHVGLWSFNKRTKEIQKIYTPHYSRPLNIQAKRKTLSFLTAQL
ncbi:MAG: hypothetical protein HY960_05810 [Ignavibacteriae bacterium]|nr:hypothetical protein [Ignavibacteriota bacterium]